MGAPGMLRGGARHRKGVRTVADARPQSDVPWQMSRLERMIFPAGDVFGGGGSALLGIAYLFFLTDLVGLAPGVAGLVFGAGKAWDALSKPIVGQLSDNTRTRWGRRRPFLVTGAVAIVATMAWLWAPARSGGSQVWLALASLLAYITAATAVTTPFNSMATETTTVIAERNRVNVTRLLFSTVAGAVVTLGATLLVQAVKRGSVSPGRWYAIILATALVFALPVLAAGIVGRERVRPPAERGRFRLATFRKPLAVPAFRSLLGLYLAQALALDVITANLMYYAMYVTRVNAAAFFGVILVVELGALAVVNRLVKRVGKGQLYGALLPLGIAAGVGIALWPRAWPTWPVYGVAVLLAVGICGAMLMSWVMFPDVVDAGELQQGERLAGTYSGLLAFVRGLGAAVVVAVNGAVLQLAGYRASQPGVLVTQPASAIWGIRGMLLLAVVGFLGLGWWLARRYPLTPATCHEIRRELDARGEQA